MTDKMLEAKKKEKEKRKNYPWEARNSAEEFLLAKSEIL